MSENTAPHQSREWIAKALLALMRKKEFSKITVKEIAAKAGVARLTFYRHFETKEDVLRFHLSMLFEDYTKDLSDRNITTLNDALSMCFDYWRKSKSEIDLFISNNLESILYAPFSEYLKAMLAQYHYSDSFSDTQNAFLVGGLYFSMLNYISGEEDESPDEAAASIFRMLALADLI